MKIVEMEWAGEDAIRVTWVQGAQASKSRIFDSRDEAEFFAHGKMGKTGYIISTLDMTAEQLAAHKARQAAARAYMAEG